MKFKLMLLAASAFLTCPAWNASATTNDFSYLMGEVLQGQPLASSMTPWSQITFQQITSGTVRLTILNANLSGSESVGQILLNLDPSLRPKKLVFNNVADVGDFDLPKISLGEDSFKLDGMGEADIKLVFSGGPGEGNRFGAAESISFDISGIPGLSTEDFQYKMENACGDSPYAAELIKHTGNKNSKTVWIGPQCNGYQVVPEPDSSLLILIGLLFAFACTRVRPC